MFKDILVFGLVLSYCIFVLTYRFEDAHVSNYLVGSIIYRGTALERSVEKKPLCMCVGEGEGT